MFDPQRQLVGLQGAQGPPLRSDLPPPQSNLHQLFRASLVQLHTLPDVWYANFTPSIKDGTLYR